MTQLFWVSVLVLPFNIIGNSLVLLVYKKSKLFKKSFLLLVNLALADLCFGVGEIVFLVLNKIMATSDSLASLLCQLNVFLSYQTLSVSVFTLMAMAIERYVVIITPFRLMTVKASLLYKTVVVLTWLVSLIITTPFVPFVTTQAEGNHTASRICTLGTLYFNTLRTYHMLLGVTIVLVPYVVMCVTYTRTIRFLWDSRQVDKKSTTNQVLTKSRQRLTALMVAITLLFTLCWIHLPIRRGVDLILQHDKRDYILIDPISIQILCVHSTFNPILYSITSSNFRQSVRNLFYSRKKLRVRPLINENITLSHVVYFSRDFIVPVMVMHGCYTLLFRIA